MWLTILGFFKTGVPIGSLSRYAALGLLLIAFSLGIALSLVVGERNEAVTNLQNANSVIKQKDKAISDKDQELGTKETEITGCLGQVEQLNEAAAKQSLAQIEEDKKGQDRAGERLDSLPTLIETDRQAAATPEMTTRWLTELYK